MKKSMFKGMAAILAFAIVLSLMPTAFAEGAVEIVSVFSQSGQDISKPIKVLALIPEGAENVTLSLGDTALTTAVTNSELYGEGYSVVSGQFLQTQLSEIILSLFQLMLEVQMYQTRVQSLSANMFSLKTYVQQTLPVCPRKLMPKQKHLVL